MKKIYWLAAMTIVISLGSCSNDRELDGNQTKSNREIGFRSFIDKGANSRATVTNDANILGFTVTGWWDKGDDQDITTATDDEYLFNAFDITRREAAISDNWSYSPLRYWPSSDVIGGGVSFFAYSPASSIHISNGLYNFKGGLIEYTVPNPSKTEPQEDLLMARTGVKTGGNIMFNFTHVLSRVRFFARTTNTNLTYVIGGVEMLGLNKRAKIDIEDIETAYPFYSYDDTGVNPPVVLWKDHEQKGKIGINIGESPINLLGVGSNPSKYYSLQGETNALMVMPQKTDLGNPTLTNPQDDGEFLIKVSYKAYLNNPDGTYFVGDKDNYQDVYFQVYDKARSKNGVIEPFTFEIGRQYNFCLEFGSEAGEDITFSVDVSGWNNAAPGVTLP